MFSFNRLVSLGLALGSLVSADYSDISPEVMEIIERQTVSSCTTGVHMMIGGGCTIPCAADVPDLLQTLINNITTAIPGSDTYFVPYDGAQQQAQEATPLMEAAFNQYLTSCPNTPIVFIGYSLGGIIVMNTLCGGVSYSPNVISAIVYGEETFHYPAVYDLGSCTASAPLYARNNTAGCAPYANVIHSYCDAADPKCCTGGDNVFAHYVYDNEYDIPATNNVLAQFNAFKASSSSSSVVRTSTTAIIVPSSTTTAPVVVSTTSTTPIVVVPTTTTSPAKAASSAASSAASAASSAASSASKAASSGASVASSVASVSVSKAASSAASVAASIGSVSSAAVAASASRVASAASVATSAAAASAASASAASVVASSKAIAASSSAAAVVASSASAAVASSRASAVSASSAAAAAGASATGAAASAAASSKAASASASAVAASASKSAASAASATGTGSATKTTSTGLSVYTGAASALSVPGFAYIRAACGAWKAMASMVGA